jgi:hypothetical protein
MAEYLYRVKREDTVLSICLAWDLSQQDFERLNPDFGILGDRCGCEVSVGEYINVGNTSAPLDAIRILDKKRIKK